MFRVVAEALGDLPGGDYSQNTRKVERGGMGHTAACGTQLLTTGSPKKKARLESTSSRDGAMVRGAGGWPRGCDQCWGGRRLPLFSEADDAGLWLVCGWSGRRHGRLLLSEVRAETLLLPLGAS